MIDSSPMYGQSKAVIGYLLQRTAKPDRLFRACSQYARLVDASRDAQGVPSGRRRVLNRYRRIPGATTMVGFPASNVPPPCRSGHRQREESIIWTTNVDTFIAPVFAVRYDLRLASAQG